MKAYILWINDDEDQGAEIVFADTAKEAKKKMSGEFQYERWIDIRVKRDKRYDGLENLSPAQLACKQWHDGWQWYDLDHPQKYEATDAEFIEWYERTF